MMTFLFIWVIPAIFAYGFAFGHLQREWPETAHKYYDSDKTAAILMAIAGPIGLLVLIATGSIKHGLKFW